MNGRIGFVETPKEVAQLMIKLFTGSKNSFILDTGFGKGIFLELLKDSGYKNCWGIETDRELYGSCKSKFSNFHLILGDYLEYRFNEKFDLIIGNPPYAHFNQLPFEISNNVRRIIKTSEGDIYYAFIIKSISLLKEGGELIYIVPYHFFYNTHAKIVRETILKYGKIETVIDLDEIRLFNNENPETIIFKFKKGKFNLKNEKIRLLNIRVRKAIPLEIFKKALDALQNGRSNELFNYSEIPHYTKAISWSSFFVDTPDFPSVKLGNIAKVGVGLVSGFEEAFILKDDEIDKFNEEEKKLIKNFVKAKNCSRFLVKGSAPYILIEDYLKDEELLKRKYPKIYAKLIPYKQDMSFRYLPEGKKWFNWQALRNYNFLMQNIEKKRIYVPCLDRHPYSRFSIGNENLLPSGDVLFIQPYNEKDLYFLTGYLNSNFFRKYYLSKGGRRGGRISFTQKLLENIDVCVFSDEIKNKIEILVSEIIDRIRNSENYLELEKEIDILIYDAIDKKKFMKDAKKINLSTLEMWE